MTTLRAVAPRSLVIIMTRVGLSEQHLVPLTPRHTCVTMSPPSVADTCSVCDVVTRSLVGVFFALRRACQYEHPTSKTQGLCRMGGICTAHMRVTNHGRLGMV